MQPYRVYFTEFPTFAVKMKLSSVEFFIFNSALIAKHELQVLTALCFDL